MKKVVLIIAMAIAGVTIAQQQHEMTPEQKAWMDYMTPGEMHKHLAKSEGEWNATTTFWESPNSEPMVTKGKVVNKMILGGRYLRGDYTGSMMGMPFEGMSLEAYDNAEKKFHTVWIDNFGTGMMTGKGVYLMGKNAVEYKIKFIDPISGKPSEGRETIRFIDDNTMLMEMFMTGKDGKEWKSMEAKFERAM